MADFQENHENLIYDKFVQILEFNLIIIFVIFPQFQFRLGNESFEISRTQRLPRESFQL